MAEKDGVIDQPDIITTKGIEAPLGLIKNLNDLIKSLDNTMDSSIELSKVIGNTTSTKKLADEIHKLIGENKNLTKTQDEMFKRLDKLEKENKQLTNSLKDQEKQIKKNKEETEKLGNAMNALDSRIGGTIGRLKQLGKELLAIATNPIVLTLAVIIGLLAAATSAVKTFWSSTGEGEDIAARQAGVWKQFFNVLKTGWASLGKAIQDFFGEDGSEGLINHIFNGLMVIMPFLIPVLKALQAEFNRTAAEAKKLADLQDEIQTQQSINIVKRSQTQRDANKALLESQDGLEHSDIDRLLLLQRYNELKEKQLQIDLDIARLNATAVLREIGLRHSLTKAQVENMTFAERDAKFTGEEMKAIAEATAAVIDLEATYFQEVKKNSAKILYLKEEMHKKEVELSKKAAQDILRLGQEMVHERDLVLRQQIADVQKETTLRLKDESLHWTKRVQIVKDSEELIKQMRQQAQIEKIKDEIAYLEVSFKLLNFDAEEQAKVAEKLKELKLELINDVYEVSQNLGKTQLEKDRENLQKVKEIYEEFANSIGNLFNSFSENRMANLDRELEAFERNSEIELAMAGDNDERKKEIENGAERRRRDFDRRRITEQRKAAIFEKATSLIQAAINTALAVTKALPNFPLAIAAGIAGAIQIIAIASKQIPQYAKGGRTTATSIIAGEKGFEHYRTPEGVEGFTPDKATIMDLPVGTQITSHKETLGMIARRGIRPEVLGNRQDIMGVGVLGNKIDELNYTMRSKPVVQVNYTSKGVEGLLIKGLNKIRFNGDLFR